MSSISGLHGLNPTLNIIPHTKAIAIANKESIICAWNLIETFGRQHHIHLVQAPDAPGACGAPGARTLTGLARNQRQAQTVQAPNASGACGARDACNLIVNTHNQH